MDGFVTVNVTAGGPVSISVGVQGYFTASPGSAAFTLAHSWIHDSRQGAGATAIPAGGERSVAVSGVGGIPAFGSGISALAMTVITHEEGWWSCAPGLNAPVDVLIT